MLLQPVKHCDHCCAPTHQGHICLFRYLTFIPPPVANCLLLLPALVPHNCQSFLKLASSRYCCQRLAASWCSPPGHLGRCELATRPANGRQRLASLSNCLRSGPLRAYLARVAACNAECSTCHSGAGAMRGTRESRQASWEPNGGQTY